LANYRFDREGKMLGNLGAPARYANPRLSPDGKRAAVDIDGPESSNTDIWVVEANRKVSSRFTFDRGQDETPLWSNNGRLCLAKTSYICKMNDLAQNWIQ